MLLLATSILFANVSGQPENAINPAFRVIDKGSNSLIIDFQLPAYEFSTETLGAQSYQRILLPQSGQSGEAGKPELPYLSTRIAIPATGRVQISARNVQQSMLSGFNAYPWQDDRETDSPKGIDFDSAFYSSNMEYPATSIMYSEPEIIRGMRVITLQVMPFSYNPGSKELSIRHSMQLEINFVGGKGANELSGEPLQISSAFAPLLASSVLNFEDYRGAIVAGIPPRILIIHGAYTNTLFQSTLDEFVLWKRQKGANVDVANFAAGVSNTTVKQYIQTRYNSAATRPDYIIIMGDTDGVIPIPTWTETYSSYGGEGDYPYTHLDGTDTLGDCFIGRISALTVDELRIILSKTYLYEKNMDMSTASWLNRFLLVGDWDPSGISTTYISKYIKESALDVNPDYTFTELYGASPAPASINAALQQGVGFYNYRGWLGMSSWNPSSSAANGYKIPHAVIITCGTGTFEGTTSTTETYTRLGTESSPQGAVTAIGMSTTGTHTSYNNTLNGGIFAGILTQGMRTMGEALLHGKLYLYQIYGITHTAGANYSAHWCNLMGDPTMEVFIGLPSEYQVQAPTSIPIGSSLLDIVVSNSSGNAVEGQCVSLSFGNTILAVAFTNADGLAVLELPGGLSAGTAVLTVSGHNFHPLQQNISIVAGGLIPGVITVDDNNSGSSIGNSNGLVNAGERIELSFALRNTTAAAINNLSGTISCSSPFVSISNSAISYGNLAAGASLNNSSPIVMDVANACPDGTNLRLTLRLSSSNGSTYNVSEHLLVYNGNLSVLSQLVVDTNDSALDPDEAAGIRIGLLNSGSAALSNLYGELLTNSGYISISSSQVSYGNVIPQAQIMPASDFGLFVHALCPVGMPIPMTLRIFNASGYEQLIPLSFTVGNVLQSDPLGPDAYGYVIYDQTDLGYSDCPSYNWVGIAPAEGGSGSLLTMSDPYTSTEGDQVGADALEVVTLPFSFSFYGLQYSQITVSSNGFIALGVSANAEFRNFRLPGAMGPSPMIAAFWDDLATGTNGKVYSWYDSANHRYIVEWYRMLNGYNGSTEETFQVILYDQSFTSTSTGDGPIQILYKTFNNIDSASAPRHGNFSTIGIQNHDQTIGLEYSYGNTYPTAAAPLANLKALYITTIPNVEPGPNLSILDIQHYDSNENGHLEPGESDYATITLKNIGDASATNVIATLSSSDPYVSITTSTINYGTITATASSSGNGYFLYNVASNCPQDQVLNFTLSISSDQDSWTRSFTVTIHKPVLLYQSWNFDDFALNLNGIPDPGESGSILFNLLNEADFDVSGAVLTLSESSPYIQFSPSTIACGDVAGGAVFQASTLLSVLATTPLGTSVPFTMQISSTNAETQTIVLNIDIGIVSYNWDFESTDGNFTTVNSVNPGWERGVSSYAGASSGTKVWGTVLNANHANSASYELISPTVNIGSTTQLSFMHRYHAERSTSAGTIYWDGGHVLISTNGGSSWSLITPVGGYPCTEVRALNNLPGYSGEITSWQEANFDLSAYSGMAAKLKWLYKSDGGVAFEGWFIDDIAFSGGMESAELGKVSGTLTEIVNTRDLEDAVINLGEYYLRADASGNFKALVPPGTYYMRAMKEGYRSEATPITILADSHNANVQLSLEYLPCPQQLSWLIEANTLNLLWTPVTDSRLSYYKVYKRTDIGSWMLVSSPTSNSCTIPLSEAGSFRYKVSAAYSDGWESLSEAPISFVYPYSGTDVQPLPVSGINLAHSAGSNSISWLPVNLDTTGTSIQVWAYRIYAGSTPDFNCTPLNLIGSTSNTSFTDTSGQAMRFYKVKALIGYALSAD